MFDAQADPDDLPVELSALCRQVYFAVLRRNAVTLDLGEALLAGFSNAGLEAAPIGPWALLRGPDPVYRDPGRRPLDGLVVTLPAPAQAHARDLARGLGFEERVEQGAGDSRLWRRIGRLRLSIEFRVGTVASPPDQRLLDAVRSLAAGRFGCWIGLLDVHHLLGPGEHAPEWGCLRRDAEAQGLARDVVHAFRLARGLLGTRVPEGSVPDPRHAARRRAYPELRYSSGYIGYNP